MAKDFELGFNPQVPYFEEITKQAGGTMPDCIESHALWHYYVTALEQYANLEDDRIIQYEKDRSYDPKFHGLFRNLMRFHNVDPHKAIALWQPLEQYARIKGLTILPESLKFTSMIIVK